MSTAPRRLGKYELQQPLGRGNMGEVWKARDLSTHGDVAIKILHSDFQSDPHFMTRFSNDGRTIASLQHENIVPVHEFTVTRSPQSNETTAYIAMDYIEGPTLAHFIRATSHRGNIPSVAEIVYLFKSIGSALDYAHQQGIIHGNLKPENILLNKKQTSRFEPGEPLLIDLGLTQILHTTGTVGSPFYVSPEQAKGLQATNRSDIYALGVMLYEICTSVLPFRDENSVTVMMQHINTLPTPPILINPGIPPALSEVILRAMGKDAANRFYSASFLANAIADACSPQSVLQMTKRAATEGDNQSLREEKAPQEQPAEGARRITTNLSGVSQPLPALSNRNSLAHIPAVPPQTRLFQGPTPLPVNRSQSTLPQPQQTPQETKSLPATFQPAPGAPAMPAPPQRQYYQQSQSPINQQQSYYQQQAGPSSLPPLPANIDMSVPQLWEAPLPKSALPQTPANPATPPRNPSSSRRSKSFLNVTDTPIYMVVGLLIVLLLVITSAIAASLWINNSQTATTTTTPHTTVLRQVFFEDDALGQNDQLRVDIQNMPAAASSDMYFAWLQTSNHQFQPLGALTVQKGEGTLTYPGDTQHTNLLSISQGITITLEKAGANPAVPGNKSIYQATFAVSILPYLKNILSANTDLPDQQGAANGLFETIKSMNDKAVSIVDSLQNSHDDALARRQATRIIEMIDGTQYALSSGDRPAAIPSETNLALGLLSSPNQTGYIDYLDKQLTAIQQTQTDNPAVLRHAQNVKNAVTDLRNWIQKIRTYDVQILKAANLSNPGILGVALQLKQAAADSYTGHTIPPNSNPSSDLNSAGAYQGFIEAHYLATLTLQPV